MSLALRGKVGTPVAEKTLKKLTTRLITLDKSMRNDEEKRSTPDAAFLSKNKTALNHMMKSQENGLYLPSLIVENVEVILLINSLAQRRNAGSANR